MSEVALSAGMRSNLNSLQNTSSLLGSTQERLSTGRKVNSAIDNPTNFFASSNLTDRAGKLEARLDGMGQAISTLTAADNAITAMRSLVGAMKGVVDEALASSQSTDRASLGKQFNELLVQLSTVAKDGSYKGVNLLQSAQSNRTGGGTENLTVQFNESFDDSTLKIEGINIQGNTGGVSVNTSGEITGSSDIFSASADLSAISFTSSTVATGSGAETLTITGHGFEDGDTVRFTGTAAGGNTSTTYYVISATANTFQVATAAGGAALDLTSTGPTGVTGIGHRDQKNYAITLNESGEGAGNSGVVGIRAADVTGTAASSQNASGSGSTLSFVDANSYQANLKQMVNDLETFDNALINTAKSLSQNVNIVSIRQDFTTDLINVLEEGADKLTLADLNEEGANLLALQTSQQLGIQSLSLASQSNQAVLGLLG